MRTRASAQITTALALTLLMMGSLMTGAAVAADATAGRALFRQQCALCHSAQPDDNGGAQGPDLNGILNRHAASGEAFSYSQALRDRISLRCRHTDRFLSSPPAWFQDRQWSWQCRSRKIATT